MRVISGKLKGKKLLSLKSLALRPTAERVKEAIFDILQDRFQGKNVLDLFAGTGALGIEALSRGAERAVFVEGSRRSRSVLHKNIEDCKLNKISEVLAREVLSGIKILEGRGESFDLIFLDPPYGKGLVCKALKVLSGSSIVESGTLIVTEHSCSEEIDSAPPLQRVDSRRYGSTQITFFRLEDKLSN